MSTETLPRAAKKAACLSPPQAPSLEKPQPTLPSKAEAKASGWRCASRMVGEYGRAAPNQNWAARKVPASASRLERLVRHLASRKSSRLQPKPTLAKSLIAKTKASWVKRYLVWDAGLSHDRLGKLALFLAEDPNSLRLVLLQQLFKPQCRCLVH